MIIKLIYYKIFIINPYHNKMDTNTPESVSIEEILFPPMREKDGENNMVGGKCDCDHSKQTKIVVSFAVFMIICIVIVAVWFYYITFR